MDSAIRAVQAFRHEANTNFRAVGDNEAHALGLAQKQAADVIEAAIGRAVQKAPEYFADRFSQADRAARDLRAQAGAAESKITQALAKEAPTENVYIVLSAREARRAAETELAAVRSKLEAAEAEKETWRSRLQDSQQRESALGTLPERFQDARKLFAKIYTLNGATNKTTGNVSARGLARLYNKGAPLTEELKTIAEAANAAPKSMQVPEMFGRAEDWSALDFFGMAHAALHGNVPVAVGIAARPFARKSILGPRAQRRMIPYERPIPDLPAPGAAGTLDSMGGPP
jgi:hypothetical protein